MADYAGITGKRTAGMRTSKGKAQRKMAELMPYEKVENKARFSVCIEKKMLDGKEVVTYKVDRNGYPMEPGKSMPLDKEYTSMDELLKCVRGYAESIGKALA